VGTYIEPQARFWENKTWSRVATRQFNLGVISIFWHVLIPQQGQWDWSLPDSQIELALSGKMDVSAQSLVYSTFLPDWLKTGSFTRSQLITIVQDNVMSIMSRYKGKVKYWNVVNEAGFIYPGWDFFENHIGREYIEIAFEAARQADPSAILFYNDFGNATPIGPKYRQTVEIVDSLRQKGLIDGLGVQLHIIALQPPMGPKKFAIRGGNSRYYATANELIEGLRSFDIPIYISELDVDLSEVMGTEEERFALQAQIYSEVVDAILESGVCKYINFWGFGDKYSWLEQPEFNGSAKADPTLFDDSIQPKPAYFAVLNILRKYAEGKP